MTVTILLTNWRLVTFDHQQLVLTESCTNLPPKDALIEVEIVLGEVFDVLLGLRGAVRWLMRAHRAVQLRGLWRGVAQGRGDYGLRTGTARTSQWWRLAQEVAIITEACSEYAIELEM